MGPTSMDTANTISGTGMSIGGIKKDVTAGGAPAPGGGQNAGFRQKNMRFLQDQNKEATRVLEHAEQERDEALALVQRHEARMEEIEKDHRRLQQALADSEEKCNQSAVDIHGRDSQIQVLNEQNRSLMDNLEEEETISKERESVVRDLDAKQATLMRISDQFDKLKETGNQQLTAAYSERAKLEEDFRNAQSETAQLKEAEENFVAQSKIDIESLEQKLKAAKDKNVEHLQAIQHNEVHAHRLSQGIQRLRETLDELTVQKKGISMQLDMDQQNTDKWTQSKAEVERRKAALERTVDALRQSLRAAEDQNQQMQDDNIAGADNFRQMGDKVYALMDQLRQHQMDLRKQEQNGVEKQKRIENLDRQSQSLQDTLQNETDAKLAAEADARTAAQTQALMQKKNKMLDDALQLALKAQEKVEKRLQELNDKASALQTQNDYLGTRIDGNEEDKGALRYELRRGEDELRQTTSTNSHLTQKHTEIEDKFNQLTADHAALKAELDYIRREDMLDESGRTKPILIESESKLIERLQINEFLFSAQQARNPIPMLVEKISHILEMIHTAQTHADLYLQDLQRSNSMLTALRQKNMGLYEKVQMCETWKMRALLKIASNEFEDRQGVQGHNRARKDTHSLYLDGLQYTNKELKELHTVITGYSKQDSVKEIRLQDNQLDKTSVPYLTQLVDLCPYLTRLDLKRNRLDDSAKNELQNFVQRIPGVTAVNVDPVTGDIKAKSGAQNRLVIILEEQTPPDPDAETAPSANAMFEEDLSGQTADAFLATGAGITSQTRLQGPNATQGSMGGVGNTTRTLLPPQRGTSAPTAGAPSLPRIPSAVQLSP